MSLGVPECHQKSPIHCFNWLCIKISCLFFRCKLWISGHSFVHSHHSWLCTSWAEGQNIVLRWNKNLHKPWQLLALTLLHSKLHLWSYLVADMFYEVVARCVNHKITLPTWDVNTPVLHFQSHYRYSHIDHFVQRSSLLKLVLVPWSVMYPISESQPIHTTTFHNFYIRHLSTQMTPLYSTCTIHWMGLSSDTSGRWGGGDMRMLPDPEASRYPSEGCWRNLRTELGSGSLFMLMKSLQMSEKKWFMNCV